MEQERNQQSEADDDEGPGKQFEIYEQSEKVVERLKLLDYEKEFVLLGDSFKPVSRHYFVKSTNIGEQFHIFTSICCWLIRRAGIAPSMEMPQEFDDPNATISRILEIIKAKDIELSFAASKLKSGSGPQCLFVLHHLTNLALEQNGFRFENEINVAESEFADDEAKDHMDEAELTADQFEEVEMAEDMDEPDIEAAEGDDGERNTLNETLIGGETSLQQKAMIRSKATDAGQMQEELKRVIPQLKVTVRANLKDWRMRIEQMAKNEKELLEHYAELKPFLTRTSEEIEQTMERITSREHHLNEQFGDLLKLYRNKQNELATVTEQFRESSGTLNNRTELLNMLNEEIYQLKQQIEEQGMHNTSGAPILKIKQALVKMERDTFVMRVQIATMEQMLWQSQLSDRLNSTLLPYYPNFL